MSQWLHRSIQIQRLQGRLVRHEVQRRRSRRNTCRRRRRGVVMLDHLDSCLLRHRMDRRDPRRRRDSLGRVLIMMQRMDMLHRGNNVNRWRVWLYCRTRRRRRLYDRRWCPGTRALFLLLILMVFRLLLLLLFLLLFLLFLLVIMGIMTVRGLAEIFRLGAEIFRFRNIVHSYIDYLFCNKQKIRH